MDLHVHAYYSELIDSTYTCTCTMVVLDDIHFVTCNIECTLVTVKITNSHPLTLCVEREKEKKEEGGYKQKQCGLATYKRFAHILFLSTSEFGVVCV